jgi:hypothetical protein
VGLGVPSDVIKEYHNISSRDSSNAAGKEMSVVVDAPHCKYWAGTEKRSATAGDMGSKKMHP